MRGGVVCEMTVFNILAEWDNCINSRRIKGGYQQSNLLISERLISSSFVWFASSLALGL